MYSSPAPSGHLCPVAFILASSTSPRRLLQTVPLPKHAALFSYPPLLTYPVHPFRLSLSPCRWLLGPPVPPPPCACFFLGPFLHRPSGNGGTANRHNLTTKRTGPTIAPLLCTPSRWRKKHSSSSNDHFSVLFLFPCTSTLVNPGMLRKPALNPQQQPVLFAVFIFSCFQANRDVLTAGPPAQRHRLGLRGS